MKLNPEQLKVRNLWPDDPATHGLNEPSLVPSVYCSDCDKMVSFFSVLTTADEIETENKKAASEGRKSKYKNWVDEGYQWLVPDPKGKESVVRPGTKLRTYMRGMLTHRCGECKKMNLFSDKKKFKSGIPLDDDLEYWIKVKEQYDSNKNISDLEHSEIFIDDDKNWWGQFKKVLNRLVYYLPDGIPLLFFLIFLPVFIVLIFLMAATIRGMVGFENSPIGDWIAIFFAVIILIAVCQNKT